MYKSRCKPKMVAYPQKTKTICNKCIMGKFTFTYLADAFIQSDLQYSTFRLYIFLMSMCVPWELNPQPFVLLTQCSSTEPQELNQKNKIY